MEGVERHARKGLDVRMPSEVAVILHRQSAWLTRGWANECGITTVLLPGEPYGPHLLPAV
jgi:hypothetical protein